MKTLLTIELGQRLSFLVYYVSENGTLSRNHKDFYDSMLPFFALTALIPEQRVSFSFVLSFYFLLKFVIFNYMFFHSNLEFRKKNKLVLKVIFCLQALDLIIFQGPFLHLMASSIFEENIDLGIRLLNVGNLIFYFIEFLSSLLLGFDFEFFEFNFLMPRTNTPKYINFIFPLLLAILRYSLLRLSPFVGILINFVAVVYSVIKISDIFHQFHYIKGISTYYWIITFELIFFVQSVNSLSTQIWKESNTEIDADYIFIIIILLLVNTYRILHSKKELWLKKKFVYKIKNASFGDQYMEILKLMIGNKKSRQNLFDLHWVMKNHIKKCHDLSCICQMIVFKFGKLNQRTLEQEIKRQDKGTMWYKIVLFNDKYSIGEIINEHKEQFSSNAHSYTINLESKNIDQLLCNFYYKLIYSIDKDVFNLFISYMFYCIYQIKNCVGSLIVSYNYLHSYKYSKSKSLYKRIIIENITALSSDYLYEKFKESDYSLSKERFYDTYSYNEKLMELEKDLDSVIKAKAEFFTELSDTKINFKDLTYLGDFIIRTQKKIEKGFDGLFKVSMSNSKVLHLYLKYKKIIEFARDYELKEFYDKFLYVKKVEQRMMRISDMIRKTGTVNLFSNANMIGFVNINKNIFSFAKFSKNLPEYFGYAEEEMKGMNIEKLIPKQIARHHERYVKNYLNRKSGTRLKARHFTTFAVAKNRELKVINLLIKLEYLMIDDIYLCAVFNSDPKNKQSLMLTEFNGNVVSMNRKGENLMGLRMYKSSYSLFLAIPSLLKYYFPKVSQYAVHNKLVSKKNKTHMKEMEKIENRNSGKIFDMDNQNDAEISKVKQNLQIEVLNATCFLFHLLTFNDVTFEYLKDFKSKNGSTDQKMSKYESQKLERIHKKKQKGKNFQ